MQWLLLAFTFIAGVLLQRLSRSGAVLAPVEARATLALGFLILAAYLGGTVARRIRLPRIVGYLLAGFVAGPDWLRLVRADELQTLSPIATGTLALIAFAAGTRLTLATLRSPERPVILRLVAAWTLVPFVSVALVVLTVSPWFPLTAHQPFRDALAVALALGAIAAVTSPTLTWATINDADFSGPLPKLLLDVSIVQDVAAILLLIVVLAVSQLAASAGAVTPGIAWAAAAHLFGSIAGGVVLGLALGQYLRVMRSGSLVWVCIAVAFVVAQVVRMAPLDAALLALAAGVTLRNATPGGADDSERFEAELQRCAFPVYVVFFALAGCSLDFDALGDLWPWAVLVVGLRVSGLRWGAKWVGRSPDLDPAVMRHGWLGLVSQGALALTFAAVLRRAFPEWNVSLESLVVAMIGIHMIAGPICLQWVLRGGVWPERWHLRALEWSWLRKLTGDVEGEEHAAETAVGVDLGSSGVRRGD